MADASIIGQYRDYLKALQGRVAELKRAGKSADEVGESLRTEFRARYPDWGQPLRILPAVSAVYTQLP
jgi:hypothetical protein